MAAQNHNQKANKKKSEKVKCKSLPLTENWLQSQNKYVYVIKETDQQGNARIIGYTRTRNEADLLIYDVGKKLFEERKEYRAAKAKYLVTYSYVVGNDSTNFVLHERSLGYLYNGHKIDRFNLTFEKVNRAYNRLYTMCEMGQMETEIHGSNIQAAKDEVTKEEGSDKDAKDDVEGTGEGDGDGNGEEDSENEDREEVDVEEDYDEESEIEEPVRKSNRWL